VVSEEQQRRHDRGVMEAYEWRLDRLVLPDGRDGVVCYFRDISAQVAARRALEDSRDALRDGDRRKDEFLATLAHELRNPLAPLRSCLDILRHRPAPDPESARLHEVMARQLGQMVRLVDDLLEVSRITRGKIELRLAATQVGDVVERAVETSRPLVDAGRHALTVDVPAEPLVVAADGVRLAQVLSNLLNNASKYTDAGGRIHVRVSREGGEAVLAVEDSGMGMAPEQLGHVFDLFAQGQDARFRDQGGLGIGLTLSRRLVELHGGTLSAHSAGPGQGSTFTVRLPLL
jgi:signal transduction histidine kinase